MAIDAGESTMGPGLSGIASQPFEMIYDYERVLLNASSPGRVPSAAALIDSGSGILQFSAGSTRPTWIGM